MPINSPRRGELNGLRVKFNRRCFFQPSPRRDSPKISLAYVSRVYEKTSLRGRTRGKSDLPFLVIASRTSPRISRRTSPLPIIFPPPPYTLENSSLLSRARPSCPPSTWAQKRDRTETGESASLRRMNCLANLHSNAINVNRSASRQRLIRLY